MKGYTNVEAVELFIIKSLIKGKNVVIPDFGHLEIRYLRDRRTVLFKSTESNDSFLRLMSIVEEKEKLAIKALYIIISTPLKEEKIVTLPKIGTFRPVKLETGEIHVSFILSTYLRRLLFEKAIKEIQETRKQETRKIERIEKIPHAIESKKEIQEARKNEVTLIANKIQTPRIDEKLEPAEIVKSNNVVDFQSKTDLPDALKTVKANERTVKKNTQVMSEGNDFKKRRSKKSVLSRYLKSYRTYVLAAIMIALTVAVVSAVNFRDNKKQQPSSRESNTLPSLAEMHYGHPAFWIYIYEANKDQLDSPININISKEESRFFIIGKNSLKYPLIFPDLKAEYDVDITDNMEIQRAKIKADILLKEMRKKK